LSSRCYIGYSIGSASLTIGETSQFFRPTEIAS
jgi:hypothetical protein